MRYFLFIVEDPTAEPYAREKDTIVDWVDEIGERGIDVEGSRLRPSSEARTVRIRGGETLVTNGPFTEAAEVVAGFHILECANLDEAIEAAGRHPMARFGRVEVRPFWPFE